MSGNTKRNIVVATMAVLVCAAVGLNWKYSILLPLLAGKAYGPLFYQVYAGRGRFMKAAKRAPLSRGPSPLLFTFWPGKRARPWG